jgi:hypothetical protein
MHMRSRAALILAAASFLSLPTVLSAQVRGSEKGMVAQVVDGTTIQLEYHRPAARGRALFGDLVPHDAPWTGANWATTFAVDRGVRVNGVEVPAGKYSVWMIPRDDTWTFFLDPRVELYHFQKPDSTAEQIHIAAQPEKGAHVETLTWSFPAVTGAGTVLAMQWGETRLPLDIVVQPSSPPEIAAEVRAQYLGSYDVDITVPVPGWPTEARMDVYEEDGRLRARLPFSVHPGDALDFDLVPAGIDRFNGGHYQGGELFNIEMGVAWEFELEDERAVAVRIRGVEGSLFGEGRRAVGQTTGARE